MMFSIKESTTKVISKNLEELTNSELIQVLDDIRQYRTEYKLGLIAEFTTRVFR